MQPVINAPEIATAREQQLFNGKTSMCLSTIKLRVSADCISTTIMNLLWY